jgi:hypothetical protein
VFFDERRDRIYVSYGEGAVDVVQHRRRRRVPTEQRISADHVRRLFDAQAHQEKARPGLSRLSWLYFQAACAVQFSRVVSEPNHHIS